MSSQRKRGWTGPRGRQGQERGPHGWRCSCGAGSKFGQKRKWRAGRAAVAHANRCKMKDSMTWYTEEPLNA